MPRRTIIPYEGSAPYVFVSYAHKDSNLVMPVLAQLHELGYRIWFDDGIAPGSEWPENIAQHLNDCALTMAFVSPNSIASDNCRREVTFALSKRKPFLGIILQKTEMSLGMEMQLSAQQCVMKYAYATEEEFIRKVCTCPELAPCLDPNRKQEPKNEAVARQTVTVTESVTQPAATAVKKPQAPEIVRKEKPERKRKADTGGKKPRKPFGTVVLVILIVGALIPLISILRSQLTKIELTDGKTVSTDDIYLSLYQETVTPEIVQKIGKMKNLETASFRECTFQAGALDALELPDGLSVFTAENCAGLDDLAFLENLPQLNNVTLLNCGITDEMLSASDLSVVHRINLSGNEEITDLSVFAAWQSLTELNVSETGVKKLDALENSDIRILNFSGTAVSDVKPLANMRQLANVNGSGSQVSNIDALASVETLTTLNFGNCRIDAVNEQFSALRLGQLWLENNELTDWSAFSDCTLLKQVGLAGNRISDISILEKNVQNLTYLSLSGNDLTGEDLEFLEKATLMEGLHLDGIPMQNLDFAENMTMLYQISAVSCGLEDISGLHNCTQLNDVRLANNRIRDISALKNISTALSLVLDLSFNELTDLSDLPTVRYNLLALVGEDVYLSTLPEVAGWNLLITYQPILDTTHVAKKTFNGYHILGCPVDEQVKTEDLLGAYRVTFLENREELIAAAEELQLDYSFLNE